jgi:glycosyltransferase involved in cell wall biosynthesis
MHLIGQLGHGGAEKQLWRLSTAMSRLGWPQAVVAFSAGGAWGPRLLEAGIPVACVPNHRLKPWRLWRLFRLVRRQRPQVVVSWSIGAAAYARWVCGRRGPLHVAGVRLDLTVDSNTSQPARGFWWIKDALEHADCAVSNSRRNLDILRERGVRFRRAEVVRNIVPAPGRARPGVPTPTPRIISIGTLNPRKAHDVLLRAAALLAGRGKPFELWIAGDGPERGRLERLAAELGVANRVRFLGELPDAHELLAEAHILAHAARSEGLSNAILEAMAEGVPVVATPVGATPEFIEHERTGLLAAVGCPQSLADALARLLDDPGLRQRLGQAGLERVRGECNEEGVVRRYAEIFRSLLADGRRKEASFG